jgi:hypothetical protein
VVRVVAAASPGRAVIAVRVRAPAVRRVAPGRIAATTNVAHEGRGQRSCVLSFPRPEEREARKPAEPAGPNPDSPFAVLARLKLQQGG